MLIGGAYPLTQIYQHKEDATRGDRTISSRLGIGGTFLFTFVMFVLSSGLLFYYFVTYYTLSRFFIFAACLAPVMVYFLYWARLSVRDNRNADFAHTMLMNKISACCMVVCFTLLYCINRVPVLP